MESLLSHVMSVNGLHQIPTWYSHHRCIHSELQLPCAQLWVRVHAREPESVTGEDFHFFITTSKAGTSKTKSHFYILYLSIWSQRMQFLFIHLLRTRRLFVCRPCGVLVPKGEHMGSSLRHAPLHIRNNKVEAAFGLVQRKLYVHLQHFQIWIQKTKHKNIHFYLCSFNKRQKPYFSELDTINRQVTRWWLFKIKCHLKKIKRDGKDYAGLKRANHLFFCLLFVENKNLRHTCQHVSKLATNL